MLNFYILCKHLKKLVDDKQPLERQIQLIIEAVSRHELDIAEEEQND